MARNPIQTMQGKRRFIRGLCKAVAKDAITAVPKMPMEWDGHELRELLAEMFADCRSALMRESAKRRREFQNERYIRGLP